MKYLITQSLISSWNYMFECNEDYAEEARQSFIDTLKKVPSEVTEAMQNGLEFENQVYRVAAGLELEHEFEKWENGIKKVAAYIRRAPTQVRLSRTINVGEDCFLVYGILDALKAGVIYDVKFKNKSFGSIDLAGSYLDSPQHPFYFYICPEAFAFRYLVSDGEDLYIETYHPEHCRPAHDIIKEFVEWLKLNGLHDTYKEYWTAK